MKFIKVNYSEPVDNFFFGNNYKYEDEDLRYFEDLTLLDQTWNNDEIDMMDNKENISCNQNTPTYHNERLIKEDIPSPDPEDFSLNSLNQRENSEQLVNRFLDSDYPELSPKMQELMKMHDFMKIFIHKITRVPDAVLYNEEEINQGFSIDESVFRKRECIDQVLMKRSYNAFKVLTSYSILNTVTENAKFIGKELLKIFHPKSEGNFNHFKPLWNHLIKITHGEIALLLTSDDEYKEPPIYQMLRYIHEPAITSSLISTIFLFDAEPDLQVELFTKLQEMEFIETLLTMLDMKDFPVIVQATSEFLIQMIEEGSKTKNSSILFAPIQLDPSCLSVIIKHISENKSPVHQQACIQLLLAFLEKYIYYNCDATTSDNVSINTMTSSSSSTLELLKSSLMDYLKYSIDDLCMGLTDAKSIDHVEEDEEDKFYDDYQDFFEEDDDDEEDEEGENDEEEDEDPNKMIVNNHTPIHNHECIHSNTHKHINSSYRRSGCDIYNTNKKLNYKKLKCRLTVNKIGLLKIIIITLQEFKREEYDLLENIPWSLLVNWFFQNPSNNIYHTLFFKFFEFALKSNSIPILNSLFIETNLIQQFIDNFNIPRYVDCKGYILLMCNHIRFTYESQPEGFFQSLLEKNSSWKAFLPQLKAATRDQLGNRKLLKSSLGPYPPLPYTPTPMTITSTTTITTTNNNNNSNDNNNISSNNDKYLASLVRKVDEYQSMNEEELDSLYAALLGYRLTKEKKKKTDKTLRTFSKYQPIARQSNSTLDLDLISSESTLFNNYQESNVKSNRSTLNLDLDLDLDLDIDLISESTLYHDDDTYQESNSIQPKSFLLTTTNDTTTRTTQEDYPSYFIMDTPTPTPTTTPNNYLFHKKNNFKKSIFLSYEI